MNEITILLILKTNVTNWNNVRKWKM